jgi:hypothetical protein
VDQTQEVQVDFSETLYVKYLQIEQKPPFKIHRYGISSANYPTDALFLTIDLCPSSKLDFEQGLFEYIRAKKIPIAIAISGLWGEKHTSGLNFLKNLNQEISITWVNHSYHHPFSKYLPDASNFLLEANVDAKTEILKNEQYMLEQDLLPSIFIRYPGLVSNEKLIHLTHELGLLPLASDAWLAEGEVPKKGSIILVHGNGNEPLGIKRLMPILDDKTNKWGGLNQLLNNTL